MFAVDVCGAIRKMGGDFRTHLEDYSNLKGKKDSTISLYSVFVTILLVKERKYRCASIVQYYWHFVAVRMLSIETATTSKQ